MIKDMIHIVTGPGPRHDVFHISTCVTIEELQKIFTPEKDYTIISHVERKTFESIKELEEEKNKQLRQTALSKLTYQEKAILGLI